MRSFLGVPIVARDEVIGAFYLTEKEDAAAFDEGDRELIELLAAHAAIAITNARAVRAQPRALDPLRAQPARARAPRRRQPEAVQPQPQRRLRRHPAGARPGRRRAPSWTSPRAGARGARRAAVADPGAAAGRPRPRRSRGRAAQGDRDAAPGARRRGRAASPTAASATSDDACDFEVLRIAHEALHNAVRHAAASRVDVRLHGAGAALTLEVADDGIGFDPRRSRAALAPPGADLDGGARPGAGRRAGARLSARGGDHRQAGGARDGG